MRLLITGSSGNVGLFLSQYFATKGTEVYGLDLYSNPYLEQFENFNFRKCDVTNRSMLLTLFNEIKPTHVIHLAFLMKPLHDVNREYEIDVIGSKNVIEISNLIYSVKQFIQFSSTSAYGAWPNNPIGMDEEYPLRPQDYHYGINKKKIELFMKHFAKRNDLNFVILRMCTALGNMRSTKGGLVNLISNNFIFPKYDNVIPYIQFLHEDDLNSLVEHVLHDEEIEGTYNLVPEKPARLDELTIDSVFLPLSLKFMRGVVGLLWKLKMVKIRPAAITLSAYSIVADGKKLAEKYAYEYKHTTKSGFFSAQKALTKK